MTKEAAMWKQISEEQFYVLGELGIVCFYWPKNPDVGEVDMDWFDRHKPYFNFDAEKNGARDCRANPNGCTYWTEVESSDSSNDSCDEVMDV